MYYIIIYDDIMGLTPSEAADKFEEGWLASKQKMISNFTANSRYMASDAISRRRLLYSKMRQAFTLYGDWYYSLRPFRNNSRIGDAYREKMNSITEIPQYQKDKVIKATAKIQRIARFKNTMLLLYKEGGYMEKAVPPNITDNMLMNMLVQTMIKYYDIYPSDVNSFDIEDELNAHEEPESWPDG